MTKHAPGGIFESVLSFVVMICRVIFIVWVLTLICDQFLIEYMWAKPIAAWNTRPLQIIALVSIFIAGFYDIVWIKRT